MTTILTDIEGTTSSISFVKDVLFPYARRELPRFVRERGNDPDVRRWLDQVAIENGGLCQDAMIVETLQGWIDEDRKHTALKALQGLIWEAGYHDADFTAPVYPDVATALQGWHAAGHPLAVYSSGSVPAQKLLFTHTDAGDLSGLFSGWFDTAVGGKREAASYTRIAAALSMQPGDILFLSDVVAELDAAREAGMRTTLIDRREDYPEPRVGDACNGHPRAESFHEVATATETTAPLPDRNDIRIAVIGLGYVGLPLAAAFGRSHDTVGFDIDASRVAELRQHQDRLRDLTEDQLKSATRLSYSDDAASLAGCNVFIVTVPTPIDDFKRPDLGPLESASRIVGKAIGKGGVAIFESTVYPGATEEVCVPIIERESGLTFNVDFSAGYSPERINPGDKQHRLETVIKVTSGSSPAAADFVDALYAGIVSAGTHKVSGIRVAEAAKVIENTQRDVNIALVNELALIFHRLGIDTHEVLEAAGTKWNFLPFRPGLVGGHCIGVDPYYLTHKAQQTGYHPEVILAGRRINDSMGGHVAQRVVKLMQQRGIQTAGAKVLILGLTFKENCPDLRNTRVVDVISELRTYNVDVDVHDPWVPPAQARHEYGIEPVAAPAQGRYDAIVLAVAHREFTDMGADGVRALGRPGAIVFDVKRALPGHLVDGCL